MNGFLGSPAFLMGVLGFLFVLWLLVEVIAISVLGTNANNTFRDVRAPSERR